MATSVTWLGLCCRIVCVLLVANATPVFAQATFPPLSARVMDVAELLHPGAEALLNARLAAHERETGNQLVVATTPSLDGRDIAQYALTLARQWQLGSAENDNGVLILVAPAEREVRIEVGRGLEGALTDATAGVIIRQDILPAFRENDYARGIELGVDAALAAIAGEYQAPSSTDRAPTSGAKELAITLFFIACGALPPLLHRVGLERYSEGAFPAAFVGLFVFSFSANIFLAVVAAVIALLVLGWYNARPETIQRRNRRVDSRGYDSGVGRSGRRRSGGGFSGGGGSFGGGGASGRW